MKLLLLLILCYIAIVQCIPTNKEGGRSILGVLMNPVASFQSLAQTLIPEPLQNFLPILHNGQLNDDIQCGRSNPPESQIVGGLVAKQHEAPWQVGLLYNNETTTMFFCGAAVLTAEWIITAAHCIAEPLTGTKSILDVDRAIIAALGDHILNSTADNSLAQNITVARPYYPHPAYGMFTGYNNDVALLRLSSAATLNAAVAPICLPENTFNTYAGIDAYVTGYGRTDYEGDVSHVLKKVHVKVLSRSECRSVFGFASHFITDDILCAIGSKNDNNVDSTCNGDSGGPLVAEIDGSGGAYEMIGIVNFGTMCGQTGSPSGYNRVTTSLDFIKYIINFVGK